MKNLIKAALAAAALAGMFSVLKKRSDEERRKLTFPIEENKRC